MADQLKIVIDADVQKAVSGLDKLEKEFKQTQNAAQSFGANIAKGTNQATAALAKLPNTSGAATQSLLNLSRVAQDAPFGFLGIANNLNPLLESFQRLKVEAKAAGTSVKSALLGALTGPAGIGLAVGVASSLLISFGDDLLDLISPSKQLGEALDKAADGMKRSSTDAIVLVKALQSGTLSTQEFRKAKKELIDIAPEFQSSFDGDTIKIKESEAALKTYIAGLVKTIKVTAALGIVNDTLKKSFATLAKGGELSFGESIKSFFAGGGTAIGQAIAGATKVGDKLKEASDAISSEGISNLIDKTFKSLGITFGDFVNDIDDDKKKIKKSLESLNAEIISRAKDFIKQFGEVFVVPDLEVSFTNTKEKVLSAAKKLLSDIDKNLLIGKTFGVRQIQIPVEIELVPTENSLKTARDNLFKNANIFGDTTKIIKGIVPGVDKDVADRNKKFFDDFQKNILATATLVTDVLAPAFTGMFDAIAAGENPLKAFFSGLTDAVKQLIKKLIQAALQAAILSALTGGTSGAFGGFSKIFAGLLGFTGAAGGSGFGLGGQIAGRSFNNTLNVVVQGQISGQTILLAGQRAAGSNIR